MMDWQKQKDNAQKKERQEEYVYAATWPAFCLATTN